MARNAQSSTPGASAPVAPAARKRKVAGGGHVTTACNGCRRRRAKCSGLPNCQTCQSAGEICSYTGVSDGRKPPPKPYVEALEHRVKILEALLEARGVAHDDLPGDAAAPLAGRRRLTSELDRPAALWTDKISSDLEPESLPVERLKIDDDTGELRAKYGPTSAFAHLPDTASTSPPPPTSFDSSPSSLHLASHTLFGTRERSISVSDSPLSAFSALTAESEAVPTDWSRNLPEIPGFDKQLHDHLLDLFFSYFCVWCCWTDPDLFRRDLQLCDKPGISSPSRTSYYSPVLHNAILSLAVAYCDDPRIRTPDAGILFAANAKEAMDEEAERPMLSTVQGLMLLGSFYSGRARHGLGWLYAGMGLRMSTTLGLGIDTKREVERGVISPQLSSERDTTFWCLYVQDKLWSLYVGRAASLSRAAFDSPLPRVTEDRDARPWRPVENFEYGPNVEPGEAPGWLEFERVSQQSQQERAAGVPNRVSLNFESTCRLAIIAERMMETVYSLRAAVYSAAVLERVSELHLQLEKWMSDLPMELQISPHATRPAPPHILMLNCFFNFLILLLHRPFYQPHLRSDIPINDLAAKRCERSATRIVQLLELFRQSPGLRFAPISLTQMSFCAGTIHLGAAVGLDASRAPAKASKSSKAASACVTALQEMGGSWKCATQSAEILDRLRSKWCPPPKPQAALATMDPDFARQLRELGWTPPTGQALAPDPNILPSSSLGSSDFAAETDGEYSPFFPSQAHPFLANSTFTPTPAMPFSGPPHFTPDLSMTIPAANPYSDEGFLAQLEGAYAGSWGGAWPTAPGAFADALGGDDAWLRDLGMDSTL